MPPPPPRSLRLGLPALAWVALLLAGCVQWQRIPVAPAPSLPRWVRVTTRDSVQHVLRDARVVAGDTVVGLSVETDRGGRLVRIPASEIAHVDARVPSGLGSIGVALLVLVGLGGALALVGHASTL